MALLTSLNITLLYLFIVLLLYVSVLPTGVIKID